MIILSDECKTFLKKHLPDYEKYTDIDDLLIEIDDLIVLKGMVNQDYLNSFGEKAQDIFDKVYADNCL